MKQNGLSVGIPYAIVGEGAEIRYHGTSETSHEWLLPDGHKRVQLFDTENGFFTDAHIADSMIPDLKAGKLVLFDQHLHTDPGGSNFRRDVRAYVDETLLSEDDQAYISETQSAMRQRVEFFPKPKVKYDVGLAGYVQGQCTRAFFGAVNYVVLGLVVVAESFTSRPAEISARPSKREPS